MNTHNLCHYNTILPISYSHFKIDIEKMLADLHTFLFKNCEKEGFDQKVKSPGMKRICINQTKEKGKEREREREKERKWMEIGERDE